MANAVNHPVPLVVKDPVTRESRPATDEEFEIFKMNKTRYGRWLYMNRKVLHTKLVESGEDEATAWSQAFQQYPKPDDIGYQRKNCYTWDPTKSN